MDYPPGVDIFQGNLFSSRHPIFHILYSSQIRPSLIPILKSFFKDRKIVVKWEGVLSKPKPVARSGPQGGTAGGILEYLSQSAGNLDFVDEDEGFKFIDDANFVEIINLVLSGLASFNSKAQVPSDMAVDSQFLSSTNYKTQQHLDNVSQWTESKQMKLNCDKTKYMIITFCSSSIIQTRLYLNEMLLDQVRETKLLGVIITDDLKWHKNTENLTKRAYKRMSILHNLVNFNVVRKELIHIYILYIRSVLEQSCVVWGTSITDTESQTLERVQKCALRIIYQTDYIDYTNALSMSGLPELSKRRVEQIHRFADKCIKNQKTRSMFPLNEQVTTTRHTERFSVPFASHERLKNSALVYMTNYLNSKCR